MGRGGKENKEAERENETSRATSEKKGTERWRETVTWPQTGSESSEITGGFPSVRRKDKLLDEGARCNTAEIGRWHRVGSPLTKPNIMQLLHHRTTNQAEHDQCAASQQAQLKPFRLKSRFVVPTLWCCPLSKAHFPHTTENKLPLSQSHQSRGGSFGLFEL